MHRISTYLSQTSPLRQHIALSLVFFLSRVLLDVGGVRFNMVLDWMFLSDPGDLRDRLAETLYYSHGWPPGMNLLTGLLLKISDAHAGDLAHALFHILDLVLVNALFYMGRVLGLSVGVAFVFVIAYSLTPQVIYFEHLYLYETPVIAPLCLAAALFHRAVLRPSFWPWFWMFLTCAVVGWIRSSYHLVWFVAMLGLALFFTGRRTWPQVLAASVVPVALLLALYTKNLIVFDVFAAHTWSPGTLTTATIRRLNPVDRAQLIQQGKLSPFAGVDVYRGPRHYLRFFEKTENPKWPAMLNTLEQPSLGAPNYNHWFFLEINQRRKEDLRFYFKERRPQYFETVVLNLREIFSPSTEWHPYDEFPSNPHRQHREALGSYEAAYKRVIHGIPLAPMGVYPLLVVACFWGAWRMKAFYRARQPRSSAVAALLAFLLFQVAFVVSTGILFAAGEAQRYRFQVDPFLWLMGIFCAVEIARMLRRPRSSVRAGNS